MHTLPHYPQPSGDQEISLILAKAEDESLSQAQVAAEQDAFWKRYDRLFDIARQGRLLPMSELRKMVQSWKLGQLTDVKGPLEILHRRVRSNSDPTAERLLDGLEGFLAQEDIPLHAEVRPDSWRKSTRVTHQEQD